jgi:hypothetical protein
MGSSRSRKLLDHLDYSITWRASNRREPVLVLAEQFGDIGEQDVGGIGPPRVSLSLESGEVSLGPKPGEVVVVCDQQNNPPVAAGE